MGLLVLDCSVTMAWLFREELTPFAERVLDEVDRGPWPSCRRSGRSRSATSCFSRSGAGA